MINVKKVGLTALAGSLAAVSANAGEISVSGAANLTYKTGSGLVTQSLGMDRDVKFSGSGEVNGYTVSFHTVMTDAFAVSSSATVINMGSLGSVGLAYGGGTNVNGGYDETYPRAYEENSDAGGQSAANYVGNFADDNAIVYQAPAMEVAGLTINSGIEYSLQASGDSTAADGGTISTSDTWGDGYGIGVKVSHDSGLTAGAYFATRENKNPNTVADVSDEENMSGFVNYSMGPVSVGYQQFYVKSGLTGAVSTTTNAKTVGTSSGQFEGDAMSIAFNVNDDLSISYAEMEETFDDRTATQTGDVTQESESLQIAYSMGSMSIKAYTTEITNPNYDEDAVNLKRHEIALGLAF